MSLAQDFMTPGLVMMLATFLADKPRTVNSGRHCMCLRNVARTVGIMSTENSSKLEVRARIVYEQVLLHRFGEEIHPQSFYFRFAAQGTFGLLVAFRGRLRPEFARKAQRGCHPGPSKVPPPQVSVSTAPSANHQRPRRPDRHCCTVREPSLGSTTLRPPRG